jgi:hypothetical protein
VQLAFVLAPWTPQEQAGRDAAARRHRLREEARIALRAAVLSVLGDDPMKRWADGELPWLGEVPEVVKAYLQAQPAERFRQLDFSQFWPRR